MYKRKVFIMFIVLTGIVVAHVLCMGLGWTIIPSKACLWEPLDARTVFGGIICYVENSENAGECLGVLGNPSCFGTECPAIRWDLQTGQPNDWECQDMSVTFIRNGPTFYKDIGIAEFGYYDIRTTGFYCTKEYSCSNNRCGFDIPTGKHICMATGVAFDYETDSHPGGKQPCP